MSNEQNGKEKARHNCQGQFDSRLAGPPIVDYCEEEANGIFWAGNCECELMVDYCPLCGQKAWKSIESIDGSEGWAGRGGAGLKGGS